MKSVGTKGIIGKSVNGEGFRLNCKKRGQMSRISSTKKTGASIWLIAVFVLAILIVQPCFSECEFDWKPSGGAAGFNRIVRALTIYNGQLIAGGSFTSVDGVGANYIAAWDGNSWHSLGGGFGGSSPAVYALTVYNGKLIAGGYFTKAGDVSANHIAAWDGNSWQPLGSGMSGSGLPYVYALTVYNGQLIAGGRFATAGGADANLIAAWDGNNWHALGSGMGAGGINSTSVRALTVYDGQLVAGGGFATASGLDVNCIAGWDGNNWHGLGGGVGGLPFDYLNILALTVYNGELIAGGPFPTAGGVNVNNIAAWNGNSWHALGSGTSGYYPWVYSLTIYDGELIAGGQFIAAGGTDANYIAAWDGNIWQRLKDGMNWIVYALTVYNGDLTAGGDFTTAGDYASAYLARWGVPNPIRGDLNHDCRVGFYDLGLFVERWLDEDCLYNGWCYEADLNYDGGVDFSDYAELAFHWLEGD